MTFLLVTALLAADPTPVELAFEDQFDRKPVLSSLRGGAVVLVYGDRKANDACQKLGGELHVAFHPTAKGLPAARARQQPASALADGTTPAVHVMPVACCGKVPKLVRGLIRSQVKGAVPDVPVWLDFDDTMAKHFGMRTGEANVVVFDAKGVLRHQQVGTPDAAKTAELVKAIAAVR